MPGDLCGAIRFAGLVAEGARGIAAEGHRDALAGLLPATSTRPEVEVLEGRSSAVSSGDVTSRTDCV